MYFVFYCLSIPGILRIIYTTGISARWEFQAVVCCSTKILFFFPPFSVFYQEHSNVHSY